ncbi:MAG: cryptochrome/photolyase family protein [Flavobacteriales bacterium]|jgi:deoxyribodipyrimidine photolyase-related protein
MNTVFPAVNLVFPHQLHGQFPQHCGGYPVVLIEEELFFTHFPFHKKKLVLHRASMKAAEEALTRRGESVVYIESGDSRSRVASLFEWLAERKCREVFLEDPVDYLLMRRLRRYAGQFEMTLRVSGSRLFLNTAEEVDAYFAGRKRMLMHDFYVRKRKQEGILLDQSGQPSGGKWSFDADNRKRFPKGARLPEPPAVNQSRWVDEATRYVNTHFQTNPGITDSFCFPVTREEALTALDRFLAERFNEFGAFQDAMVSGQSWLHHSILSSSINTGLLHPREVIDKTIRFAEQHGIALNNTEGFIRQILGWREYIRGVYVHHGVAGRTRNYWNHTRSIPTSFWNGTTGIAPVDDAIRRTLRDGYTHHIDRLMILGNFMLLCEFDPDQVYHWFMSLYIDAYDWVMVPNVYGMSQFADGGLMSTKPYISGSAYVLKMSDYPKGDWTIIWDALFWRFIHLHRDFFTSNPRLSMMVNTLDKMDPAKKQFHLSRAEQWLHSLDA